MNVGKTLEDRGARYGQFEYHANITQALKEAMRSFHNERGYPWVALSPDHQEALDMIMHKVGRILNGDPNYSDSWHDIAGYAILVEKDIAARKAEQK